MRVVARGTLSLFRGSLILLKIKEYYRELASIWEVCCFDS